jgi:hypothetical protein
MRYGASGYVLKLIDFERLRREALRPEVSGG